MQKELNSISSFIEHRKQNMLNDLNNIIENWNNMNLNDYSDSYPFDTSFDEIVKNLNFIDNFNEIKEVHMKISNWIESLIEEELNQALEERIKNLKDN